MRKFSVGNKHFFARATGIYIYIRERERERKLHFTFYPKTYKTNILEIRKIEIKKTTKEKL